MKSAAERMIGAGGRQCGGCTLCCKLVPVEDLAKLAGMRCANQRTGKGCAVYAKRPSSCRHWSCMWLIGTEGGRPLALSRPDRVHYVIDEVPDLIRSTKVTGEVEEFMAMQIWVDPLFPDAHRDPQLRAMLEREGIVALVRYNSSDGFVLFPPGWGNNPDWVEQRGNLAADDMIAEQRAARMAFWQRQHQRNSPVVGEGEGHGAQKEQASGSEETEAGREPGRAAR